MARYFGTNLIAGDLPAFSSSQNAALNSGITQALVDDTVYKSTPQTISGNKTFTGVNTYNGINNFTTEINRKNTKIERGATPSVATYQDIRFTDTADKWLAGLEHAVNIDKSSDLHIILSDMLNDTTNVATEIVLWQDVNGNVGCDLPSTVNGTTFKGTTFTGTSNRALYADLAENYRSDGKYPIGTLIKFGGEKDITLADTEVNGVISDKPGYLLDSDLEDSQPVALVGKTPIRIVGKVKRFDKIVLSEQYFGMGRVRNYKGEKVIAIALEESNVEEEKLIMCVTKFSLDD